MYIKMIFSFYNSETEAFKPGVISVTKAG